MLGPIRTNLSKDEAKSSSICDDIRKSISDIISRRSKAMTSLSQVECTLKHMMEGRANVLAEIRAVLSDRGNSVELICSKRWSLAG